MARRGPRLHPACRARSRGPRARWAQSRAWHPRHDLSRPRAEQPRRRAAPRRRSSTKRRRPVSSAAPPRSAAAVPPPRRAAALPGQQRRVAQPAPPWTLCRRPTRAAAPRYSVDGWSAESKTDLVCCSSCGGAASRLICLPASKAEATRARLSGRHGLAPHAAAAQEVEPVGRPCAAVGRRRGRAGALARRARERAAARLRGLSAACAGRRRRRARLAAARRQRGQGSSRLVVPARGGGAGRAAPGAAGRPCAR